MQRSVSFEKGTAATYPQPHVSKMGWCCSSARLHNIATIVTRSMFARILFSMQIQKLYFARVCVIRFRLDVRSYTNSFIADISHLEHTHAVRPPLHGRSASLHEGTEIRFEFEQLPNRPRGSASVSAVRPLRRGQHHPARVAQNEPNGRNTSIRRYSDDKAVSAKRAKLACNASTEQDQLGDRTHCETLRRSGAKTTRVRRVAQQATRQGTQRVSSRPPGSPGQVLVWAGATPF